MLRKKAILFVALLLSLGLTLTACGEDDPAEQDNNVTNNNTPDAGEEDAGEEDTGEEDAGEEDTGPTGCTSNDQCIPGEECDTASGECVPEPTGCELTGDDRPDRCDKDYDETDFGPGSLITSFQIAGRVVGDEIDPECCFDYTGDDQIDNELGATILDFDEGTFNDLNASLSESIEDGSLILMFEHAGLTDLSAEEDYNLNFFLGEYDTDGTTLLIDPASVDEGTQPMAQVENAKIQSDALGAGPGSIRLDIELLGTPLSLLISQAQIEATVDLTESSIADGVWLTDGKLGGVIRIRDILDTMNDVASECDCLELDGDPLISYNPNDLEEFPTCNAGQTEAEACNDAGQSTCGSMAQYCGPITFIVPGLADVDTTGDDQADAVSIGAKFETEGATFGGIAPE
jgi:hypothetical protein